MKEKMAQYLSVIAETSIYLTAGLVALRFLNSRFWGQWKYNGSLKGKVIIVTGANSGIGKSVTSQLAAKGARIIMACRDEEKTKSAIEDIRKSVKEGELVYRHLDLENLNSVRNCVQEITSNEEKIDVLICNAGLFEAPFKLTPDGFERHFQVNHLAHAMLQILLLPKLTSNSTTNNDEGRIVSVTSKLATTGYISEADFIKNSLREISFNREKAYPKTKLYSLLFNKELAKQLKNKPIKIYSASPGFALTNLSRYKSISWYKYLLLGPIAVVVLRTAFQGAQTVLEAAFPTKMSNVNLPSGSVLRNCHLDSKLDNIVERMDSKLVYNKTLDILTIDSEVEKVLKLFQVKKHSNI